MEPPIGEIATIFDTTVPASPEIPGDAEFGTAFDIRPASLLNPVKNQRDESGPMSPSTTIF